MPMHTLNSELYWLTLTVIMTGLMWLPYIVNRVIEIGLGTAIWDPQGITQTKVTWADRMMRAHANAVENMVIFIPLVLIVQLAGLNNSTTALACALYFYARLAHVIVFTLGIPLLRIPAFMAGVIAQAMLALSIVEIMV